ncbi:AtpZ/AtpI family protein [Colibacter massiliensis]|uniref:AtpZ/AtpI family protein n=2 Tax=Colibacter massiliensis TaxID=1852379 RepID=UPI003C6FA7CA
MRKENERKESVTNKSHAMELLQLAAVAGSLGLTLFVNILVGVGIGRFVDVQFGTTPFGLLFFSLLGSVTGFWALYKKVAKPDKQSKE